MGMPTQVYPDPTGRTWARLNEVDLAVFHLGDDVELYGGPWDLLRSHSGVVVLHNSCLQTLLFHELNRVGGASGYLEVMRGEYGEAGHLAGRRILANPTLLSSLGSEYPLVQFALRRALGVVVTCPQLFQQLQSQLACPILLAPKIDPSGIGEGLRPLDVAVWVDGLQELLASVVSVRLWTSMSIRCRQIADGLIDWPQSLLGNHAREIAGNCLHQLGRGETQSR